MSAEVANSIQSSARNAPACEPSLVAGRRVSPASGTQLTRNPGRIIPVLAVRPPSTGSATPVTYDASSESSHAMAAATSSGRPKRPSANVAAHLFVELGRTLFERRGEGGAADRARAHRVHPHTVGAELEGGRTREVEHATLRHVVRPHARVAEHPGDRGGDDDRAPCRTQLGDRRAHPEDHPSEVHGEHAIELLDRLPLDRSTGADARVQHDSVQGTEVVDCRIDHQCVPGLGRHINDARDDPFAAGLHRVDPSQRVAVAIHGNDRPAVGVQAPRGGQTDAGSRTGDDRGAHLSTMAIRTHGDTTYGAYGQSA